MTVAWLAPRPPAAWTSRRASSESRPAAAPGGRCRGRGITLSLVPAWSAPTVTTADCAGATSRDTIVCRRRTVAAAITTGSMLASGIEPWAPRPNIRISRLSAAEVITPERVPMLPAGAGTREPRDVHVVPACVHHRVHRARVRPCWSATSSSPPTSWPCERSSRDRGRPGPTWTSATWRPPRSGCASPSGRPSPSAMVGGGAPGRGRRRTGACRRGHPRALRRRHGPVHGTHRRQAELRRAAAGCRRPGSPPACRAGTVRAAVTRPDRDRTAR